jgi:hypothetical protein
MITVLVKYFNIAVLGVPNVKPGPKDGHGKGDRNGRQIVLQKKSNQQVPARYNLGRKTVSPLHHETPPLN